MARSEKTRAGELRELAAQIRRRANESRLPGYREKMEKSATELEAAADALERAKS
jgi:hypothetical protein